jgi:broad specificity phosphatase PhoE
MQPTTIVLSRHAISEGNLNENRYNEKPPHLLELAPEGVIQATRTGNELAKILGSGPIQCYCSSLIRAVDTWKLMKKALLSNQIQEIQTPLLRTQSWGLNRTKKENTLLMEQRESYGVFHFHVPGGEACSNVYDRVCTFTEMMYRHFQSPEYPPSVVIVTHGMTLRLVLMSLLEWTETEFESYLNPENCELIVLELVEGKYKLITKLKRKRDLTKPN